MIGRFLRGTALAAIIGFMVAFGLILALFIPIAAYQILR